MINVTDEQKKQIKKYVNDLKQQMWLASWRINVVWDNDLPSDAYAEIEPVRGRKVASLRICEDFFDLEQEVQFHTLVHELLHCYSADVQHLETGLIGALGSQAYSQWHEAFTLVVENMVDALATLLAEQDSFLPKPDFKKEKKHAAQRRGQKS